MENLQKFIAGELTMLDRSFIATPNTLEDLEAFAKSNHGSSDLLLMQMAMNYGYKIALESMKEKLEETEDKVCRYPVESMVVGKEYYFDDGREAYGTYMGIYKGLIEFTPTSLGNYTVNERGYVDFLENVKLGFILKED